MQRPVTSPGGRRPLSACLELLFDEPPGVALESRVAAAAAAGIGEVEIWGWRDRDLEPLRDALRRHRLRLRSLVVDPMLPLADPERRTAFLEAVASSVAVADWLGAAILVVSGGPALPGVARRSQLNTITAALRAAAPLAAEAGIVIGLENLNSRIDHPGCILDSTRDCLDVVDAVDVPAVRLLYDVYHSLVMGESPQLVVGGRVDRICHVQVADVPGRHEPGSGAADWPGLLDWLWVEGYRGSIGLEYVPTGATVESLTYVRSVVAETP
jgi:hydroxypyruvate isomerase